MAQLLKLGKDEIIVSNMNLNANDIKNTHMLRHFTRRLALDTRRVYKLYEHTKHNCN
jgi:hypothetical protein